MGFFKKSAYMESLGELSEADKKFFAERNSGYTGPLDQDGNRVTSGPGYDALKRMADERGEDTSGW